MRTLIHVFWLGVLIISGSFTVALATPAAHAELSLSQSFLNFYDVPLTNFGPTQSVSITNLGDHAVELRENDSCYVNFTTTSYCTLMLEPNSTCTISVQFNPRQVGTWNCSVTLTTNDGASDSISVMGQGVR